MKKLLTTFVLAAALSFGVAPAFASVEVNEKCHGKFPEWFQYFERKDCVKELEKKAQQEWQAAQERQIQADIKRNREEVAIPCLSKDVLRMEEVANKIKSGINMDMTFEEATKIASDVLGKDLQVRPTAQDIKTIVAIGTISTTCPSDFSFLVNVKGKAGEPVSILGVWSQNPPRGYANGQLSDFSLNYDYARGERVTSKKRAEAKRAEDKKRKAREAARRKNVNEKLRKQNAIEAENKRLASLPDHCASDLEPAERLRRLRLRGAVREGMPNSYKVNIPGRVYSLLFSDWDGRMIQCY